MNDRIKNNKEKILIALRKAGREGVTNVDLSSICLRYGGVISDLHIKGYDIDVNSVGGGVFKYTLISEPEKEMEPKKGLDILIESLQEKHEGICTYYDLVNLLEENNLTVVRKPGTYKKMRRGA